MGKYGFYTWICWRWFGSFSQLEIGISETLFWGVLKQIQADVEYSTNILGIAPSSKLRQTLPDTAWKISFHQELSIFKVYFSFARW